MKKSKVLGASFFNRPTVQVAQELIGKLLCRRVAGSSGFIQMRICETEAYDGSEDRALHARGDHDRGEDFSQQLVAASTAEPAESSGGPGP